MTENFALYLSPTYFIDFEHPEIQEYVTHITQSLDTKEEKAIALYYAIRDGFRYNPYKIFQEKEQYQASSILQRNPKHGHCIDKAVLLAACARAIGVPSRLRFANVCNHIGTEKLEELLGTNTLVFHGSTDLFLYDNWVTATPAFNKELCVLQNVAPLEFDGKSDSLFQEYDHNQNKFMQYLHSYGHFTDLPFEMMWAEWAKFYPNFDLYQHLAALNKN